LYLDQRFEFVPIAKLLYRDQRRAGGVDPYISALTSISSAAYKKNLFLVHNMNYAIKTTYTNSFSHTHTNTHTHTHSQIQTHLVLRQCLICC
jgi:hypothetical protein